MFGYFVVTSILGTFPAEFYDEIDVKEKISKESDIVRRCGRYTITEIRDVEASIPEMQEKITKHSGKHIMIGGSYHPLDHIRSEIIFQRGFRPFDYKKFKKDYENPKRLRGQYYDSIDSERPKVEIGKIIQIKYYMLKTLSKIKRSIKEDPEARYADFAFYDSKRNKIPNGHTLVANQWYQLEVAVRDKLTRIGIPSKKRDGPLPKFKRPVTIMVTAKSLNNSFEIEEPVSKLILPPRGNSTENAWFEVRPLRKSLNKRDRAEIEISLFYEFNLLEVAVIKAEVVGEGESPTKSLLGFKNPISFVQKQLEREYIDFDNIQPREMNINITKKGSHFLFTFTFYNDVDNKVIFSAPVSLSAFELKRDLKNIRELWYKIAMSKTFAQNLNGDSDEFLFCVRELAQQGQILWTKLFKINIEGSIATIGDWLREHPLQDNATIQISIDKEAVNFIFPWALIYDGVIPTEKYELPDPKGFWGIRYCIEQFLPKMLKKPDDIIVLDDVLNFAFILWRNFANANDQKKFLDNLCKRSGGRLNVHPIVTKSNECFNLLNDCGHHILYFYAHGFTRHHRLDISVVRKIFYLFKRLYKKFDKNDKRREIFRHDYENIQQEELKADRSWIELTYGKLYLDDMYYHVDRFKSHPFVFLNTCESAQVTQFFSDSFAHLFLDRGASGFIGTECPMTTKFAHPFSEKFLEDVLSGEQVGKALLNARQHFMEKHNNPLALAYTLFGSTKTCFKPPVLR